jgi:hypothetical protein
VDLGTTANTAATTAANTAADLDAVDAEARTLHRLINRKCAA